MTIIYDESFNVSEKKIIELMESASNDTIEVALCCCEQGVDDFISAYFEVVMHNLKLNYPKNIYC